MGTGCVCNNQRNVRRVGADPDRIQNQSGQWIRIQEGENGQKKFIFLFFKELDVLSGGLKASPGAWKYFSEAWIRIPNMDLRHWFSISFQLSFNKSCQYHCEMRTNMGLASIGTVLKLSFSSDLWQRVNPDSNPQPKTVIDPQVAGFVQKIISYNFTRFTQCAGQLTKFKIYLNSTKQKIVQLSSYLQWWNFYKIGFGYTTLKIRTRNLRRKKISVYTVLVSIKD